jgi:hypothetical protein
MQSRFIQCLIYELYLEESGYVKKYVTESVRYSNMLYAFGYSCLILSYVVK